jgi:beta-lactamase regulating signal transducer with metallopeptidase domain
MKTLILNLNPLAAAWLAALWRACWQGGLALLLVWAVCRVFHRLPARAKSWLWRLAYMKLLVAFLWAAPIDLPLFPARMPRPAPEAQRPVSTALLEIPSPAVSFADPTAPAAPVSSVSTRVVESQVHSSLPAHFRPNAASWLLLIWSLGVGSFGICAWRDLRRARLLLRGCVPVINQPLLECSAELARSLGLRGTPSLMMTDAVSSPLLLAGSRPVIVLPSALASGSTLQHLRLMIAHEMAHLKRLDLWWVWLAVAGEGLFFFHPILWLARREWRLTQEMACDEMAVRLTRALATAYGEMLVGVAALKQSSRVAPILVTLGLTETKEMLARRLNAMKHIRLKSTKRMVLVTGAILVVSAVSVLPWQLVAQPAPRAGIPEPPATRGDGTSGESIDAKIARLNKKGATVEEAIQVLGEPRDYAMGTNYFAKTNLPDSYLLGYPGGIEVWIVRGKVAELRSLKPGPGFSFRNLHLGSSLNEVMKEVGRPSKVVTGESLAWILNPAAPDTSVAGVLYKDIDGTRGFGYYHQPKQHLRFFLKDDKVIGLLIDLPTNVELRATNGGPGPEAVMGAPEYEVDGRIDLRLSRPDRSLLKNYQGSFRVYVKGCAWLIQVTEMNDIGGIPQRREVGTSDGKEMFEMVVPYEPISPSDPVVFDVNAGPPGVHMGSSGTVASSAIPVGEQDNSFTGHLWLMFASGFYFRTATSGGQLTPMFDCRATPYMNNHATMKATWELIEVDP